MSDDKVRENRARRAAARQRLSLVKSRRRDPNAWDYGLYMLTDENNGTVLGDWTHLDNVEDYLRLSRP